MQTLKIKATIDIANPRQMLAASTFIAALNGTLTPVLTGTIETATAIGNAPPPPAAEAPKAKEEKPKRSRRTKEQIEVDKIAADAAKGKRKIETPADTDKVAPAPAAEDTTEADNGLTLEAVREAMAEKMPTHKDAIKGKFKELGATKMSTLKKEDYQTFYDFLKSL